MSSRLSQSLAEFSTGRRPDGRGMDPRTKDLEPLDPRSMGPPLHPSERGRFESSVSRWVPVAFLRFIIFFFIGVATTVAWQSYGNAARRMVARLTPGLAWLAPPAASAAPPASASHEAGPAAGASPDQLAALSRGLAAVRQSVDRLAADVVKLQTAKQDPPAATPPPVASARGRKPVAQATPSR